MASSEHAAQLDGAEVAAIIDKVGVRKLTLSKKSTNLWTAKGPSLEREWSLQLLSEKACEAVFPWVVTLRSGQRWVPGSDDFPPPLDSLDPGEWVGATVPLQMPRQNTLKSMKHTKLLEMKVKEEFMIVLVCLATNNKIKISTSISKVSAILQTCLDLQRTNTKT